MSETTNQVRDYKANPPNKNGKGGFGDHPENRSDGRWSKDNSFTYWLNFFKNLSVTDFKKWASETPETDRSVAADLAYVRVMKSRADLKEFIVVADRTEGKAKQAMELTGSDGTPLIPEKNEIVELVKLLTDGTRQSNGIEQS